MYFGFAFFIDLCTMLVLLDRVHVDKGPIDSVAKNLYQIALSDCAVRYRIPTRKVWQLASALHDHHYDRWPMLLTQR